MSPITDDEVKAALLKHDWTIDLATPEYQAKAMAKMRAVLEAGGRDQWLIRAALEAAAKVAREYSNARPGDICEVQAGDWQYGIAGNIRQIDPTTILATLEK